MYPVPVSSIAQHFDVSRSYVYILQKEASKLASAVEQEPSALFDDLCQKIVPDKQVVVADDRFYEKMIISLALDGTASEEGIQRILENNFQKHVSIGKISQILDQAARRAAEFDESVDLSAIRQGASDEIFQCGNPVLTGVDADTGYVYLLQPADDRTADTWENAMETCKSRHLDLGVSISDFGTGLLSGIPKAFPDACIQPDLFHFLRELGKEISSQERKVYAMLSDYYKCEASLCGKRIHEKTLQKMLSLEEKLLPAIECCDRLLTLYCWLREMTGYQGYSYQDVLSLCYWILDQMEDTAGITDRIRKVLAKTRKNLSGVLVYLERAEKSLREYALKEGYPEDTFVLLYRLRGYPPGSREYRAADRRLRHILRKKYADAYLETEAILKGIKRASSLVENLNGRLRRYMNLKRMIPGKFLTQLKVYFNTKKYRRSRNAEHVGKSPLELLTGQEHPDFYDIVCGR